MIDPFVRSGTDHGSQTQQGALPQSQQKAGAEFRAKRTIRPVMASIRRFLATGVPTAPAKHRSDHNHCSGKLFQLLKKIRILRGVPVIRAILPGLFHDQRTTALIS